jgi:hypothetical protein
MEFRSDCVGEGWVLDPNLVGTRTKLEEAGLARTIQKLFRHVSKRSVKGAVNPEWNLNFSFEQIGATR